MPNNKKKKKPTLAALQFCQAMIATEIFSLKYLFFVFLFFFFPQYLFWFLLLEPREEVIYFYFSKNPKNLSKRKKKNR